MAFVANTLVNGEWTTRTLDVNAVLRHYDQQDQDATSKAVEVKKAPAVGILSQTVIPSPVVHWILPAKLRAVGLNDVAFIGDNFVQIKQLRPDGHLWDVIRKDDFGARIRNACIVGSIEAFSRDYEHAFRCTQIKDEDAEMSMDKIINGTALPRHQLLPPQVILLQLDSGDSVFLMLRQSESGDSDFVSSRHRVSKTMLKMQPGMQLAVDPSSRYMAIGGSEGIFAVYALKSREDLQEHYSQGHALRYVESERHIYIEGVICKIEFLWPSSDDQRHVIMLVLVVRKGKTRMLFYEWAIGSDLRSIRAHSRRGHLLEAIRQVPLLVIPLRIKSAFILVSEQSMSICKDFLQGSPRFIDINHRSDPPTELFNGSDIPLWTSWARPVRNTYYTVDHDDIYFVREDGLIKMIETDTEEDDLVKTEMSLGRLLNSCGPAFACLDFVTYYDDGTVKSGDLLLASGDSCAGGAYLTQARDAPKLTEWIHNWSPAHDLVLSSFSQDGPPEHKSLTGHHWHSAPQPGRVFTCAGKGRNGTVTELRYGLQASIGLEMSYDAQIMDIWVLSSNSDTYLDDGVSLFLLSLGDRSSVLQLSSDASEILELGPTSTQFDLTSRTLVAGMHDQVQVQVTEQSVVFVRGSQAQVISEKDLLGIHEDGKLIGLGARIDSAFLYENHVIFSTCIGHEIYLRLVKPTELNTTDSSNSSISPRLESIQDLGRVPSNATCLNVGMVAQKICVIIAEHNDDSVRLTFQFLNGTSSGLLIVPSSCFNQGRSEVFANVAVASESSEYFVLVCGTRNGAVITIEVEKHSFRIARSWSDIIGATPAIVKVGDSRVPQDIAIINCNEELFALRILTSASGRAKRTLSQVFLTDTLKPSLQQPVINSMARLRPTSSGGSDRGILIISGQQILLAALETQPKAIPRNMAVGGWPSRILFSQYLGCLVVAASVNGRSSLLFMDPVTGEDISHPLDKKLGSPVDFVTGMGHYNEQVFRLFEWSYMKGGKSWMFIVVCLSTGRLLVISTRKERTSRSNSRDGGSKPDTRILYWTLHNKRCRGPVYSVAGSDQGLFYCSGDMLYCETLDDTEKRFKQSAEYRLPSPATNLTYRDGKIYALTTAHSLEILKVEFDEDSIAPTSINGIKIEILRTHGDRVTRDSLHHTLLSMRDSGAPIDLISDKASSIVGLRAIHGTRADTLEPVFEAQLPSSILRFCSGNCRPPWDTAWSSGGASRTVPNEAKYSEILGLSIDGSLFNFTLLDHACWRFLKFLVNLAKQSSKVYEYTSTNNNSSPVEPASEPKIMMHVDGDELKRCLKHEILEELLCIDEETEEAQAKQAMFVELLQGLHHGLESNAAMDIYVEQAYRDLEFFLRPVL